METLRSFIIFKLEYLRSMGWGAISNFITKFSENKKMEPLDVKVVSSLVLKEKLMNNFSLIKKLEWWYWKDKEYPGKRGGRGRGGKRRKRYYV